MNLEETKAKILLADDDDEVLAALGSVLISEGYEVIFAKNGREAIEHFREGHIDVALLDLSMPVKGGWEANGKASVPVNRATADHPIPSCRGLNSLNLPLARPNRRAPLR